MAAASSIETLVAEFGFGAREVALLARYVELLRKWARASNLTASTRWEHLAPLLREAVWAAASSPAPRMRHLDIGSGAGFPAVPLQILRPAGEIELVEPRWKRAVFLETVVSELPLPGVRVHPVRLDTVLESSPGGWDCVSWKALRLGRRELDEVVAKMRIGGELWIFHGKALPVEDPGRLEALSKLVCRVSVPGRVGSFRSIYAVSRET